MKQLVWGVVLAVLLSRALMSGAVMLDPDTPDSGVVVLCSGHGPLILDAAVSTFGLDSRSTITRANDGFALVDALTHDSHDNKQASSDSDNGMCAFSAALFAALTSFVLLVLLFPATVAARVRIRPVRCPIARSTLDDRPPSRAPPLFV